jgi:hypothetical protein
MKSEQIKKEVCFHEAGHWVVAQHSGFKVGEIKISIIKNGKLFSHSGSSKIFPRLESNSQKSIENYLRNRIYILFSGVISQTLCIESKNENTANSLLMSNGSDDYKTITELLCILRGICYPDANSELDNKHTLQLQGECWVYSNKIVQELKEDITTIALKMEAEIKSMNLEYVFNGEKLASWLQAIPSSVEPSLRP